MHFHFQVDRSGEYTNLLPFSEKRCVDIPRFGSGAPRPSCVQEWRRSVFRAICGCEHAVSLQHWEEARRANVCAPLDVLTCRGPWLQAPPLEPTQLDCPAPCQKILYEVVADGSPIKRPMMDNSAFFAGSSPPADGARNVTYSVVMLFYPSLVVRTVQLSKASLMDWLSAFGGQLSLFIGASVITMLEMVFFAVRVLVVATETLTGRLFGKPRVGCVSAE